MALLDVSQLSIHFGGVKAVQNVSFSIDAGIVYSVIGPNGAGKTTLFNLITGVYKPTSGDVRLDGEAIGGKSPNELAQRGVARTFQNLQICMNMTALENVMVGRHVRTKAGVLGAMFQNAATKAEEAAIRQKAIDLLHYVRIEERADDLAKNLSYGDQRRLEIARALATEPKLLCLDEPAAGMNATETAELRELVDGIRRDGTTILLIEHDVKLVMGLCDRVAVLDYGALVIEDVPAVVQKDQRVIEAYLGA